MTKYQAYAEYKDSGVEWLDAIPKDWALKKHKYIAVFSKGKNPALLLDNYSDGLYPYLSMDSLRGKVDSKYAEYKKGLVLVEDNQPLIIWDGSNSGEFVLGKKGILSSTMASSSLIYKVESKFYWYVCICIEPEMRKHATGMGIPHVNGEELRGIALPLPDRDEQQKISNFLDHETSKIDHLIEKQQQLIELLKEKRQAVISHAVTKGLNPNVPMKDSGVEWLGAVPQHWEIKQNKYLLEFVTSGSRGWAQYYADTGSLFFRIANLTRDTIEPKLESIQYVEPPKGSEGERSKIKINDLLISITADLGSVCVANASIKDGYVSQHVALCRPIKICVSRWLAYFILSDCAKEQFLGSGYGGTKIQLSLEDIKELIIAVPPRNEQLQISEYIDKKLTQYELLICQAEKLIETLQERRTALISAAVTGKIDVRNWQAPKVAEADTELSA